MEKLDVYKVQSLVDKFSDEINTKSSFRVEEIIVSEAKEDTQSSWMSTSMGSIKICNDKVPFMYYGPEEGIVEASLLQLLGYRIIDQVNPNLDKKVIAANYWGGSYPQDESLLGKFKSLVNGFAAMSGHGYNFSDFSDMQDIMQSGLSAYFASEILPGICSVSKEGNEYIEGEKSWNLKYAKKLEGYFDLILKENPNFKAMKLISIRSAVGMKFNWPRTGLKWFLGASPSSWDEAVGLNFYLRMAAAKPDLVVKFLKKPYVKGDPKLTLCDIVSPNNFVGALAKNR